RTELDEADARRAIRALAARGVTTLAICLLHAYLNPVHERRLAAIAAEVAPHVTVTLSHEVSPTFREYERTSTTVVNAYVMTAVRDYLRGLGAALGGRGYRGRLFVMQSSGGVATADAMERYPVRMIESGPAAGALTAVCYGRGGIEPTVTDADLVLGYLNADYFAGGSLRLDGDGARRAIATRVAQPLGLAVEDAAWGVHAIVNTNMELATRVVSIERGR